MFFSYIFPFMYFSIYFSKAKCINSEHLVKLFQSKCDYFHSICHIMTLGQLNSCVVNIFVSSLLLTTGTCGNRSSWPAISTKRAITSHLNLFYIQNATTYDVGNTCQGMEHAQHVAELNRVMIDLNKHYEHMPSFPLTRFITGHFIVCPSLGLLFLLPF